MLNIKTIDSLYYSKLGECIYFKRKEKKMTQTELAQKVGVTRQCIELYECGLRRMKPVVWEKICEALDIYSGIDILIKIGL